MQLGQPKILVKVTKVFLQCIQFNMEHFLVPSNNYNYRDFYYKYQDYFYNQECMPTTCLHTQWF